MTAFLRCPVGMLLFVLLSSAPGAAQESTAATPGDEALWLAAREGDLARVEALVESGVDPDARTRYGASALSYAADKGAVDLVRYLLEKGVDPSVKDTFYNGTPMMWALSERPLPPERIEIAKLLLAAGSTEAGMALSIGSQLAQTDLIEAALTSESLTVEDVQAAHKIVAAKNSSKLLDLIEGSEAWTRAQAAAQDAASFELSAEQIARVSGIYRNDEFEMNLQIFSDDQGLRGQVYGQGSFALRATSPDVFLAPEVPGGVKLTFSGRAGSVESMLLEQGGSEVPFRPFEGPFEPSPGQPDVAASAAAPLAEAERGPARPWPSFRGAGASGNADGQGIPLEWDASTGRNVLWKTAVPGIALSSPIIWGDRVFLTTAVSDTADTTFRTGLYGDVDSVEDDSEHSWQVWALERTSGEVLWTREAARGQPKVKRHLKSSQANPSPATDGEHLVVNFASEGLFCFGVDGELHWKTDLGVLNSGWFYDPSYEWGFSSSPILHRGRVIVQVDIQQQSFLAAFDVLTGKEIWRTPREEIPTWGTPTILPSPEGDEVVTNGPTIRGYSFETGEELWTLGPNSEVTVATPIIADGMAIVTANYPPARPIYAIRPGQRGDLSLASGERSSEAVAWSHPTGGVYIPTPIAYDRLFYAMQMNGRLTAYDLETGERIYRQRVGQAVSFSGSAIAADGRLYFTTEEGDTYVVRAGREFALLATNTIDEVVMTTPAASDGVLVIRGLQHVYGLGEKE